MQHPFVLKNFKSKKQLRNLTTLTAQKRGRIFHRLITGYKIALNTQTKGSMKFLTLTSSPQSKKSSKDDFDTLRRRIERATYKKDGFYGFKFNRYFCLRTSEGQPKGVLHILYWGGYIPQNWISKNWEQLHQAPIVYIEKCFTAKKSPSGIINYVLSKYLSDQPIVRMSYGSKWAWTGFCKSWKKYKEIYSQMKHTPHTYIKLGFKPQLKEWKKLGLTYKLRRANQTIAAWNQILKAPPPVTRKKKLTAKYKPIKGYQGGKFIKYVCYKQTELENWLFFTEENLRVESTFTELAEEAEMITRLSKYAPKPLSFEQIRKYTLDCENCKYRRSYQKSLITEPCKTCYKIFSKTNSKTPKWKFDKNAANY